MLKAMSFVYSKVVSSLAIIQYYATLTENISMFQMQLFGQIGKWFHCKKQKQTCAPDTRELLVTWQCRLGNGVVECIDGAFGQEVVLQSLHNIVQEHPHNLTWIFLCGWRRNQEGHRKGHLSTLNSPKNYSAVNMSACYDMVKEISKYYTTIVWQWLCHFKIYWQTTKHA